MIGNNGLHTYHKIIEHDTSDNSITIRVYVVIK